MSTGVSNAATAPARHRFRRVVLALDTVSGDLAALDQAAALAARLHGELLALFVEDIDLARLARHRRVFTYSVLTSGGRELAAEHLQTALRLQTQRLCRAMQQVAARRQVKCDFEVRQGRLLAEVLAAAGDDDLVVISGSPAVPARPWGGSPPPVAAAVAQALAEARAASVLLLHPAAGDGPVLVVFDGTDTAWHGLSTAAEVADRDGGSVEVTLLCSRVDQAAAWGAEIVAALAGSRLAVTFLHTPKADLQTLSAIAGSRRSALFVIAADRALSEAEAGRRLLLRLACSVLLVR